MDKTDSVGAVINAVLMFLTMTALLFYAAYMVIRLARRSLALHQSAATLLYSDLSSLTGGDSFTCNSEPTRITILSTSILCTC
jgi:hypothetical protein